MVRRLGLGKNNHLTYASLALNPRYAHICLKTQFCMTQMMESAMYTFYVSHLIHFITILFEPVHDKTYKKNSVTNEDSDQPVHLPNLIRVFADCMCLLQSPVYAKRDKGEPLPYWVDGHADLNLFCSHKSYCSFFCVLAQL